MSCQLTALFLARRMDYYAKVASICRVLQNGLCNTRDAKLSNNSLLIYCSVVLHIRIYTRPSATRRRKRKLSTCFFFPYNLINKNYLFYSNLMREKLNFNFIICINIIRTKQKKNYHFIKSEYLNSQKKKKIAKSVREEVEVDEE